MLLTDKGVTILTVPAGKAEAFFPDGGVPGFGVRVFANGAARWTFQYRLGSKQRRLTFGTVTALPVAKARKLATEAYAKVKLGRDPAGDKAESRIRAGETMAATLDLYMPHQQARLKPLSFKQMERHLMKHAKPLHGLQLTKIDRRAIASRIAAVAAKSGAVESNRVRASLSAFFAWCMRRGLIDANPVIGTERQQEKSRDRVLSDGELKTIWAATDDATDYSAIIRILALTACRADEIASLRWSEVMRDRIILPPNRVKNGREHTIPLTTPVRKMLDARPRKPDRDFVFGRRDHGFSGFSVCKAALDRRLDIAPWTTHDLRRTAATKMAELGIAPHIIEAVLNHVSGHKASTAGTYNRATYESQKRNALERWAESLLAIVTGETPKVVPLCSGA